MRPVQNSRRSTLSLESARLGSSITRSSDPVERSRIVEKELTIRGSFAYDDEFPMVIDAIDRGDVDPAQFISHEYGLDEYEQAFRTQLDRDVSLKVLVSP